MKCQREHDWVGKSEQDIAFKYTLRTPAFQVFPYFVRKSDALENHQLPCGDHNFVSQRGLFRQFGGSE